MSLRTIFCRVALSIVVGTVIGCGPSMRETMSLPQVPVPADIAQILPALPGTPRVALDTIKDGRPAAAIATVNGKDTNPATDVGIEVEDALKKALKTRGFDVSDSGAVAIVGEVREWNAKVKTGLSGSVTSTATLYLEVMDPSNKKLYSGEYQGNASREDPSISELDIRTNLGTAMAEVIRQVVSDRKLTSLLASF